MSKSTTKTCSTCKCSKAPEDFNRKTAALDGRQPKCRECLKAYKARWTAENREEILRKSRAAYHANPDKAKRYQQMRREQDPDAWRARYAKYTREWRANPDNKEKSRLASIRWAQTPDGRLYKSAHERGRKALKLASVGVSVSQVQARIDYFNAACWICGDVARTIDHVKPLSKGGLHLASNMRPACGPCNFRKHARWNGVAGLEDLKVSILARRAAVAAV